MTEELMSLVHLSKVSGVYFLRCISGFFGVPWFDTLLQPPANADPGRQQWKLK